MSTLIAARPPTASRRRPVPTVVLLAAVAAASVVGVAGLSALGPTPTVLVVAALVVAVPAAAALVSRRDPTALLSLEIVLLFLVPENYNLVGPLKSVGNPALLVALGLLGLWGAGRVLGLLRADRANPVRWSWWVFWLTTLTAFAASLFRPLQAEEAAGGPRSLFVVAGCLGIGLIALDGLVSRQRVETLLRRLVAVGALAALIGILEFVFKGFSYAALMRLPGLTVTATTAINDERSTFARVYAGAAHPIEYAVACATLAPLALHFAMTSRRSIERHGYWLALVLLCAVIPMTVSRSGILAIAVSLGIYLTHLSGRQRFNLVVLGVLGLGVFRAAVPGLLGTLRSFFLAGDADPSIQGRTQDYAQLPGLLDHHIWFGRGLGTFSPVVYFYLDNQYLGSLLEGGVVGLLGMVTVYVLAIGTARGVRHRAPDRDLSGLGQALTGSLAALAVTAGTFDELSFHQTGFLLFLLAGCAGALWAEVRWLPKRSRQAPLDPAARPRQETLVGAG